MKKKYLITKLVIILILFLIASCQNKNTELEKKIEKLEKENAEILQKQQNIQTNTVQANPENTETKKIEKTSQPKISNYENKVRSMIASYEAERDKVSDEYGWSPEETNANGRLNEKLDDELTKVYNLIMERLPEGKKVNFRNEQRQWLKTRKRKVENSNNDEDGNSMMGGRAAANVEIMTYQEITKDRLFEFARMYDNMD